MIFKVFYQESKIQNPKRETTQSLYLNAKSEAEAMQLVQDNTEYNIEYIEQLDDKALEYEQKSADYHLTEF